MTTMTTAPLTRERPETCLSDLVLDRWSAGELKGGRQARPLRAHLRECAACRERLRALEAEPDILPPPATPLAAAAADPLARSSRGRLPAPTRLWAITGAGGTAAAVLTWVMMIVTRPGDSRGPAPAPAAPSPVAVRAKGELQLDLLVQHAGGRTEPVLPGDAVADGDVVRFVVSAPQSGFAFVVGLDAAGVVSPYHPASGAARALPAGRGQVLAGSVVLDRTLGAERFLLLHCSESTDVEVVVEAGRRALRAAGNDPRRVERLALPCRQAGVTVEKVRRP
jgi:hypothetical protein